MILLNKKVAPGRIRTYDKHCKYLILLYTKVLTANLLPKLLRKVKIQISAAGFEPATRGVKLLTLLLVFLATVWLLNGCAHTDFYFMGVNTKTFKEANYWKVGAGVVTSIAVHTAGHYAYAGINGMHVRQEGFNEIVSYGYSNSKNRGFFQAGFIAQHGVGLLLTSIPVTRQHDFTKGYVAAAFIETASYPLFYHNSGDLKKSDKYGGNRDWEYTGYMSAAIHNMARINWKKD